MRQWNKPIGMMEVGDVVEATYFVWNPLSRFMLGGWEEDGRRQFRVVAVLDIFDRDYPSKIERLRYEYGEIEVLGHERKIVVLVPAGPYIPKTP
jgi:hypothetical protein